MILVFDLELTRKFTCKNGSLIPDTSCSGL